MSQIFTNPSFFDACTWNNEGIALFNTGHYAEALRAYDKALELDPDYSSAWFNKSTALDELERYEEAMRAFDKALELNPEEALQALKKAPELDMKPK